MNENTERGLFKIMKMIVVKIFEDMSLSQIHWEKTLVINPLKKHQMAPTSRFLEM